MALILRLFYMQHVGFAISLIINTTNIYSQACVNCLCVVYLFTLSHLAMLILISNRHMTLLAGKVAFVYKVYWIQILLMIYLQ